MPLVYCDEEGKPLAVTSRLGHNPADRRAPPTHAFSVGVDEETAAAIEREPTQWRFAGEAPAEPGKHMRYVGDLRPAERESAERTCAVESQRTAARVAQKRQLAAQEAELRAMMPVARTVTINQGSR